MDTASGTDGYRHTYGSHSLPPSSKLHVPKWASASTPSGLVAQRLGHHTWVPHTYRQAMVEGRDVGGSCQGSTQLSPIARGICTFLNRSCGKSVNKSRATGAMGVHQRQSPQKAQDISDRGHPTQIQGFPIHPGLIFPPAP